MINSVKKIGFLFFVCLFVVFYQPPLFPFNSLHIVGLISIAYIIFNSQSFNSAFIKPFFAFYLTEFIFLLFTTSVNGGSVSLSLDPLYFVVDVIPFSMALFVRMKKKNATLNDVLNCSIAAALVQAFLAILAFLVPSVQAAFLGRLINYGFDQTTIDWISSYRMFGFSIGLTFATPLLQSALAVVSVYISFQKRKKHYLLFSLILLSSGIINARISIVVFLLGLVVLLFSSVSLKEKVISLSILACLVFLVVSLVLPTISESNSYMYKWIVSGNESIFDFIKGDAHGYFSYLTDDSVYPLPKDTFAWFFGYGFRPMYSDNAFGIQSDIGYVNDLFLGGLFYCFLVYGFYVSMGVFMIKNNSCLVRFVSILWLIIFVVSNIKGYIFVMNGFTNLFVLLCALVYSFKKEGVKQYDFNHCASLQRFQLPRQMC